jgi:predicted flap endonuclease-1-like 5' DNA nuclease
MALFTSNRTLCETLGVHRLQLRDVTGFRYPYDLSTLHGRPVAKTVESGHTYLIVPIVKPETNVGAVYQKTNGIGPSITIRKPDNVQTDYVSIITLDANKNKLCVGDEGIPVMARMTIDEFKNDFFIMPPGKISQEVMRLWKLRREQGTSVSMVVAARVSAAAAAVAAAASVPRVSPVAPRPAQPAKPFTPLQTGMVIGAAYADALSARYARRCGSQPVQSTKDDLKRIQGIGVLVEKKLNNLKITLYNQIAAWDSTDIKRIEQMLEFDGRIARHNWVEQAAILARGGTTEYSQAVDGLRKITAVNATGYGWPLDGLDKLINRHE